LEISVGAESNLEIQRKIIKGSKAYATLRSDLKRGCVLPPIVLGIKNIAVEADFIDTFSKNYTVPQQQSLLSNLADEINKLTPENVYIIDGLQRTNAIKQTLDDLENVTAKADFLNETVRLELWVNIKFESLAYRMLLLNAGQKPMAIKQQIEILSKKLEEELSSIEGIEIISSIAKDRRLKKGQFHLSNLSQSFQTWLQGQPNIDIRNIVMEQLLAENAIETLGASLDVGGSAESDAFKQYIEWLVKIDFAIPEGDLGFLSNETVLLGLAAAVGAAEKNPEQNQRKNYCLGKLLQEQQTNPDNDPLGIKKFEELRVGVDPSKSNVGIRTREMVHGAFREYFLSNGTKTMKDCWEFAA
jgi:hypothetical protein